MEQTHTVVTEPYNLTSLLLIYNLYPLTFSPQCFILRITTTSHPTHRLTTRPSSRLLCLLNLVTWRPTSRPSRRTDPQTLRPRCVAAARRGSASENRSAAATLLTRRRRRRRSCKRMRKTSRMKTRWREVLEAGCICRKASRPRWICWVRKGFHSWIIRGIVGFRYRHVHSIRRRIKLTTVIVVCLDCSNP